MVEAGIGGEERVAEELQKHSFPFEHRIIHDLSLTSDEKFQMDHNFFTQWYGLVLETKNISGSLEFKEQPRSLIRTKEDGHIDGLENPVVQLERNMDLFNEYLIKRDIYLPIYGAIVMAYPKQIVMVPPSNTSILYPYTIAPFIKKLPRSGEQLDQETFEWVAGELVKSHQRYIPRPVSETYSIPIVDFQGGVRCGRCGRLGMEKQPRTWHCKYCGHYDHLAHVGALREWFLLCGRTITNRELRGFFGLKDKFTASRMLRSLNLEIRGTYKDRSYIIDITKKPFNRD